MRMLADDYNRVVLDPIEGAVDSDYVNASYVDVSAFLARVFAFAIRRSPPNAI